MWYLYITASNNQFCNIIFSPCLGQFKTKQVEVTWDISITNNAGEVTFWPEGKTVQVQARSAHNALNKEQTPCWGGRPQGEGLIDGSPEDYIVKDLYTTEISASLMPLINQRQLHYQADNWSNYTVNKQHIFTRYKSLRILEFWKLHEN